MARPSSSTDVPPWISEEPPEYGLEDDAGVLAAKRVGELTAIYKHQVPSMSPQLYTSTDLPEVEPDERGLLDHLNSAAQAGLFGDTVRNNASIWTKMLATLTGWISSAKFLWPYIRSWGPSYLGGTIARYAATLGLGSIPFSIWFQIATFILSNISKVKFSSRGTAPYSMKSSSSAHVSNTGEGTVWVYETSYGDEQLSTTASHTNIDDNTYELNEFASSAQHSIYGRRMNADHVRICVNGVCWKPWNNASGDRLDYKPQIVRLIVYKPSAKTCPLLSSILGGVNITSSIQPQLEHNVIDDRYCTVFPQLQVPMNTAVTALMPEFGDKYSFSFDYDIDLEGLECIIDPTDGLLSTGLLTLIVAFASPMLDSSIYTNYLYYGVNTHFFYHTGDI